MTDNENDRPRWTMSRHTKHVWSEDDATVNHPDHLKLKEAWLQKFGEKYPDVCLESWDAGDAIYYLFPEGRIAVASYPGNSEIRVLANSLP